ncbi:MAG: GAF domain-containing protein [Anaerolineae bacterium]|nr:GAF domain-containing protein [Anaerolineae bacterium]
MNTFRIRTWPIWLRAMIPLGGLLLYGAVLFGVYDLLGDVALGFSLFPVLLTGLLFGTPAAVLISVLTVFVSAVVLDWNGAGWSLLRVGVGLAILLLFGTVVSWLRDLRERAARQLAALRHAEKALRESEERYVDLYENANDVIFTIDLQGNFTSANRVAYTAFGYDRDDIRSVNLLQILTPESGAFSSEMLQQAISQRSDLLELQPWEVTAFGKDGSLLALEVRTRFLWEEGDIVGVQGIARDVTERKRAEEHLRARERFLECLSDTSQHMLHAEKIDQALPYILQRLGETVGAARVYLFQNHLGDEGQVLCSMRAEWHAPGVTPLIDAPEVQSFSYLDTGFARWIELLGRGEVIAGPLADLPQNERVLLEAAGIYAILVMPLFVFDDWYGFLGFDSHDPQRVWQRVEIDLLRTASSDVASSIEREVAMERTQALRESAAVFTATLDLEQVLGCILEQVGRVVPNDAANIMLIDGSVARIAGWRGYERFGVEAFIAEAVFDMAAMPNFKYMIETQAPVVIPDTQKRSDWLHLSGLTWLRSYASAPIRVRGEVVGFLNVDSAIPNFFSVGHAEILQDFADYAAIAIGNARLFDAARQRVAELEAVRQVSLSMISRLGLEAVLEAILESVFKLLAKVQNAHIFLYYGERLEFGAALWADGRRGEPVAQPRPHGLTYTVAHEGEMIVVPSMQGHPLFANTPPDWNGAIIGLPLKIGALVVGVMNISYREPRTFSENELRMLRLLADQAAIAIENARLFESEQQQTHRLVLLADVARIVATTLDESDLLQAVADAVHQHFGYQSVMLFIPDEAEEMMVMRGRGGVPIGPPEASRPGVYRQPMGLGIVGHVVQTGHPYLAPNVDGDPYHYSPDQVPVRSEVCVPILDDGRVVGVIDVESDRLYDFDDQDRSLMEAVADTVAIGLRNARLFEEAHQRAEELAAALVRLEELDRLKDQFIQNVSHELRSPLGLIRGYAEILAQGDLGALQPEQEQPVAIIARRARMLGELVGDITLILEAEASPPEPQLIRLDEVAQAAVEDFQINARQAELTLVAEIVPVRPVSMPLNYMRRVLDNLLGNAVKFTAEGGTITVRVLDDGGQTVVLQVSDTGIGIAPEQVERIFDRFYQVDGSARRRYGGVGLGLALVKELIETYGGQVCVTSVVGQGTAFTVKLPAVE